MELETKVYTLENTVQDVCEDTKSRKQASKQRQKGVLTRR